MGTDRPLVLRLSWPGEVSDDFMVIEDGRQIGRIRLGDTTGGKQAWYWSIGVPLPMVGRCNGREPTREEAQDRFKKEWERFRAGLTPEQVAHWHQVQDAAAERSGPDRR